MSGRFVGWPYEVSTEGTVVCTKPARCTGWKPRYTLKTFPDKDGYRRVTLTSPAGKQAQITVHTLVAEAFIGPKPIEGMTVNHKDLNKTNNSADNLEWMSTQDNTEHARAAGRMRQGMLDCYKRQRQAAALVRGD